MSLTPQAILDILQQHALITDPQLQDARQWTATLRGADGGGFGQWLIENHLLTPFQLDFIERGNGKRLRLNDYVLTDRIGVGRMAGVFKAVRKGGQKVAVKILPPSKAKDPEAFARFQREGRLAVRLKHPNVVRTLEMGEADGLHYLAMEYLEGETLEEALKRRSKLPAAEVERLLEQSLAGLSHLHEQDVVHRDLKPGNLMLTSTARGETLDDTAHATLKLLDVGLGRMMFDEAPDGNVDLTEAGDLLGTVAYMAPEQARDAHQADVRSDLYSLGCVFYHALTGAPPFVDKNTTRVVLMHAKQAPRPLRDADAAIPAQLANVVDRLLAKDPAQRFATPAAASKALAGQSAVPTPKRSTKVKVQDSAGGAQAARDATATKAFPWMYVGVGGGVAVVGLVALVIFLMSGNTAPPTPPGPGAENKGPGDKDPKDRPKVVDPPKVTVASLQQQLRGSDSQKRIAAAQALASMGDTAHAAFAELAEALKDQDAAVRNSALQALAKVGPPTPADLPVLRAALRDPGGASKIFAANALAQLGADAKEDWSYLRLLSLDQDEDVRQAGEEASEKLEPVLVAALIRELKDPAPDVRRAAALGLGQMKSQAGKVLPNLIETLSDKNSAVRLAAIDALVMLGADAVPAVVESLKDSDLKLRQTAVVALGRMGPEASDAVPALLGQVTEKKLVKDVQEALEKIGPYAVPGLVQAYEAETSPIGQKIITDVLIKIGPEVLPTLKKLGQDNKEVQKVVEQVAKAAPVVFSEAPLTPLKGKAGIYETQLRGWFNASDHNRDGQLDKDELAIAIRGTKAKAYDYAPEGKPAPKLGPKDFTKYPDFAFLSRVDRDGDGLLNRNEYFRWAQDYAEFQYQAVEAQQKIAEAERRLLEKKMTQAMRMQTNAQIQASWASYHAVRRQWSHQVRHLEWLQRHMLSRPKG